MKRKKEAETIRLWGRSSMRLSVTGAMSHIRNRRRNIDIVRRNIGGEDPKALARHYSISVWAIYKICRSATAQPQDDPKTGKHIYES